MPPADASPKRGGFLVVQRHKARPVGVIDREDLEVVEVPVTERNARIQRGGCGLLHVRIEISSEPFVLVRHAVENDAVAEQELNLLDDKIIVVPRRDLVVRPVQIRHRFAEQVKHHPLSRLDSRVAVSVIRIRRDGGLVKLRRLKLLHRAEQEIRPVAVVQANGEEILIGFHSHLRHQADQRSFADA